ILDLYAKAQDWPLADEIGKRLEVMLPPPVQALLARERMAPGEIGPNGLPLLPNAPAGAGPIPPSIGIQLAGSPNGGMAAAGLAQAHPGGPPAPAHPMPAGVDPGVVAAGAPIPGSLGAPPGPALPPAVVLEQHAKTVRAVSDARIAELNVEARELEL